MLNLRRMEVVDAYLPAEALVEALLNVPKLQVLKLVNCRGITRLVLQCLSGLHQLQRLSLAENGKLSLQGLQQQPSITWLDLRENIINSEELQIVAQIPTLTHIVLPIKKAALRVICKPTRIQLHPNWDWHIEICKPGAGCWCSAGAGHDRAFANLLWFRSNRQDVHMELCTPGQSAAPLGSIE